MSKKELLIEILLIIAIVGFILLGIFVIHSRKSVHRGNFNNGVHENCGGHWEYQQAVNRYYYDVDYVYICDKCGELLILDEYERR